jgi:dTDP-4-amino-4,6-dideoxygalactose transaminase
MISDLVVFGGEPVRRTAFHPSVVIDDKERDLINSVLEKGEFSRFMGSPSVDIDGQLEMASVDAKNYEGQYFTFLGGHMVRKFEGDFANAFNITYAVSVNSATSGLVAAMGALGLGPGDEVITTCMSFNATATSILLFNSIPVFVDVDDRSFCLTPEGVEGAITPKTKAILVVHLLGNAADMDAIMKIAKRYKLLVIEDCAQSPGTKYKGRFVGTIGDVGVFSFQETKNMQTGEGGMVITNDTLIAKRLRLIRNHGESIPDDSWDNDSLINLIGMNFRMTELSAALGIGQLSKIEDNNRIRTENAYYLANELKELPGLSVPKYGPDVVPHVFASIYETSETGVERCKILAALRAEGIPVGSGYLRLMYENPIFLKKIAYGHKHCPWSCHLYNNSKREYKEGDCPVAEGLLREKCIWFYHIHRPNSIDDMKDVVIAFKKVFANLDLIKNADISNNKVYKW